MFGILLALMSTTSPIAPIVPTQEMGNLVVVNQADHSVLIVDPVSHSTLGKVTVGVNGHEVAVSKDGRLAYVPI